MVVKNKNYKQFLAGDFIQLVNDDHIIKAMENMSNRHPKESRALLVMLYYTGARPAEILQMRSKDVRKENTHIVIQIHTLKRGKNRTMLIPTSKPLAKYILDWCGMIHPEIYLFPHFQGEYITVYKKKNGELITMNESSYKLRYHFRTWFRGVFEDGIPPYFLRHSRFSTFIQRGATAEDIMQIKGSKHISGVYPYLHMDRSKARKLSRMI